MDTKLLKRAAQSSVLLMISVIILSVVVTDYRGNIGYVMAMNDKNAETAVADDILPGTDASFPDLTSDTDGANLVYPQQEDETETILDSLGERYLILPKNGKQSGEAVLTEDYLYRTISLAVDGVEEFTWGEDSVSRSQDGITYEGAPEPGRLQVYMDEYLHMEDEDPAESEGENNSAEDETGDGASGGDAERADNGEDAGDGEADKDGSHAEDESGDKTGDGEETGEEESGDVLCAVQTTYDAENKRAVISITLDHLYVPFLYEDEENYYIDLKKPKDVYDKILVIDAGHGGKHPGTTSQDRHYLEKNFNLAIVSRLKELLDAQPDIKVYYTRLKDTSVYLRPRVDLANEAEADYFISIHNNAYWDRYAYGTEVLYNEKQGNTGNRAVDSQKLASLCLEEVTGLLGTRNRGLSAGSETFIIGHSEVPVALIEVGYLTNRDDLSMLLEEENIALTAQGIYNAIMRAYETETKQTGQ